MSIKTLHQDILTSDADIIVHQVNCQGVMGAGLAKSVRKEYPSVFPLYKNYCMIYRSSSLGRAQLIATRSGSELLKTQQYNKNEHGKIVANVFGQLYYGHNRLYTDYRALELGLLKVSLYARKNDLTIAIPYGMGCGLAGGEWSVVSKIIQEIFSHCPHRVTIYKL